MTLGKRTTEEATTENPALLVFTVKEVASALKLSERKVWNLLREGKLKAYRAGGKDVRVLALDLEAFLKAEPYVRREQA